MQELLLQNETMQGLLQARDNAQLDLGDVLDAFIRVLGIPRSLKEANIGRDSLDMLATNSLSDVWSQTNAIPIIEKSRVLEILEMCI